MPEVKEIALISLASLIMVLTPGPNMIYLISRSICQGKMAGIASLAGIISGFIVYMVAASVGLTAVFLTIPYAYKAIKILGALYLLWLGWKAISNQVLTFKEKKLPHRTFSNLFSAGLMTNLLNPKAVVFYMALFPQFISPQQGSVVFQSLLLGSIQIAISTFINFLIVLMASRISKFLSRNKLYTKIQQWIMSLTLWGLAVRLLVGD